jgi:ATP-binding cassette, subfamily F, member 3
MPMIRFTDVALRRGTRLLLSEASFTVHHGQKVGFTGANGAGKSSLLQLLLGQLHADVGEVEMPPDAVVAHVAQEVPTGPRAAIDFVMDGDPEFRSLERQLAGGAALSGGHALAEAQLRFESIDGYSAPARAGRLMNGLGFVAEDQARGLQEFSGGWRMRLNLARALMCRSDILLLDEPTNHLDLDAVIWLQDWLIRYEGTLILISHDREFLDDVVGHILHIENQLVSLSAGNYSAFEVRRAEWLAQTQAARARQQREIARIQGFIDRFRAKATKAKQAQSRMKTLARMDVIAQAHVDSPLDFGFSDPARLPTQLLRVDEASVVLGGRTILRDVSLSLVPGDRIGLLGRNGAGKSTLMKLLSGLYPPDAGHCFSAQDLAVGYFAQHSLEQLQPAESALVHLSRLDRRAAERDLRQFLGSFGFSGNRVLDPVESFSGGEKARLVLCLLVYQRPNLLLLDEPTNHLDLDMRFALSRALQDFSGGLVLVSHDRFLLRSVADEFWLVEDGTVKSFAGDLDDYRRRLNDRRAEAPAGQLESAASRRDRRRTEAERRARLRPYESAVQSAEVNFERLLRELRGIEQRLADPNLYQDDSAGDQLRSLAFEKSALDEAIRQAEGAWLAASHELEAAQQTESQSTNSTEAT